MSRSRSRSPFPKQEGNSSQGHAYAATTLEVIPEEGVDAKREDEKGQSFCDEDVGNVYEGKTGESLLKKGRIAPNRAELGCFAWQGSEADSDSWETLPEQKAFHVTEAPNIRSLILKATLPLH